MPALKNKKHEAVAVAFVADPERIGWKAYAAVYDCEQRTAESNFSRLLKNAAFGRRIDELLLPAAAEAGVTAARVLSELAKIGFANMEDYISIEGGDPVLDFSELTRDQAAAIQEVTVETTLSGSGDDLRETKRVRFKLGDKRAALVDIGRNLGMFKDVKVHQDPDGRGAGTEAAEKAGEAEQMSEIELGRRIAFALEQAARATAPATPAPATDKAKKKGKPKKRPAANPE